MKIVNIEEESLHNIKSHKKPTFHSLCLCLCLSLSLSVSLCLSLFLPLSLSLSLSLSLFLSAKHIFGKNKGWEVDQSLFIINK